MNLHANNIPRLEDSSLEILDYTCATSEGKLQFTRIIVLQHISMHDKNADNTSTFFL